MANQVEATTTPYIVIGSKDIQSLVDTVNSQITRGYMPLGGLSVCPDPAATEGVLFSQAMLLAPSFADDDDE